MNWEAVAAISEAIGAAGVILSLVYLANQIRLSRLGAESISVDALSAGWNHLNVHIFGDESTSAVVVKGLADPDSLTEVERYRLLLSIQSYINHFMTVKKRYDAGLLPRAEFEVHARGFSALLENPGGRWVVENVTITEDVLDVLRDHLGREDGPDYGGLRRR